MPTRPSLLSNAPLAFARCSPPINMGPKAIPAKREETSSSSAGVVVITMDPDPEPEQDKPDKLQEAKAKMAEDPWASVVAAIQDNAKAVVDGLKEQKKPKPGALRAAKAEQK